MKKYTTVLAFVLTLAFALPALSAEPDPSGFAKYLPEDIVSYGSLRGGKDIVKGIGASNWYKKLKELESLKVMIRRLSPELDIEELVKSLKKNPMGLDCLYGLAELCSHEVTSASAAKGPDHMMAIFEILIHIAFIYEADLMRGEGAKMDAALKRVDKLAAVLEGWEFPGSVLAFKVTDRVSVEVLMSLIRQGIANNERLAHLSGKYSRGKYKFTKIGGKVGDLVPQGKIKEMTSGLVAVRKSGKEAAIIETIRSKTVELHWGYVDDYFVITIGPGGKLMASIVKAAEGKTKKVLANNPAFKEVIAKVKPTTVMVSYFDGKGVRDSYMSRVQPGLLEVPRHLMADMITAQGNIDLNEIVENIDKGFQALLYSFTRSTGIVDIDGGIRSESIIHVDAKGLEKLGYPLPEPVKVNCLKLIPASSLCYVVSAGTDIATSWKQVKKEIVSRWKAQMKNALEQIDPDMAETVEEAGLKFQKVIEKHWLKAFGRESAFVIDELGRLAKVDEMHNFPVPQGALYLECKDPEETKAGAKKIFALLRETFEDISLDENFDWDKMDSRKMKYSGKTIVYWKVVKGDFTPNVFFVDKYVVMSSSLKLTRKILDLAAGKGKDITTTASYGDVKDVFTSTVSTAALFDCPKFVDEMGRFISYILDIYEEEVIFGGGGPVRKSEHKTYREYRRFFEDSFEFLSVFRAWGINVTREGDKLIARSHLRMKDLK